MIFKIKMLKSNRNGPSVSTGIKEKSTLWDLVIRPKRHLLDINLKEIWNYRDLVMLFVRRDFVAKYKQTILGPFWFILNPLISTLMYTLVFAGIAKIPTRESLHNCFISRALLLELFCILLKWHIIYLFKQCRNFWQSLFPATCFSNFSYYLVNGATWYTNIAAFQFYDLL